MIPLYVLSVTIQTKAHVKPDLISVPGIIVTAVQNKEKTAERELVEALEGIADELYPETATGQKEEEDEGEMDMEAMLKKELSGISSEEKSKRIRLCKHDTACCMSPFLLSLLP
jgi:tRNA acetyltransferase TAN1